MGNGWKVIKKINKLPRLNTPVLIEGLPGIGNVGKVAVDFIIEELKAKKIFEFFSYSFPHSVFVNENNLVELPSIEIYYKSFNDKNMNDLLLLAGDIQPVDEVNSYEFSDKVLDVVEELNGKEIITLGGVGLPTIPKFPKVYCTGNNKKLIKEFNANTNLYGIVGPIVGVSGLLLGLAKKRNIPAVSLLAETFNHPMYLGVKGAQEILKILNKRLKLKINFNELEKEIKSIESEMLKKTKEFEAVSKRSALRKLKGKMDMDYIG